MIPNSYIRPKLFQQSRNIVHNAIIKLTSFSLAYIILCALFRVEGLYTESSSSTSTDPTNSSSEFTQGEATYYYPSNAAGAVGIGACGNSIITAPAVAIGPNLYDTENIEGNPSAFLAIEFHIKSASRHFLRFSF
ncbi:hypothetical protein HDU76_008267 [Blyttiomyces sp. JEL0837]|nr:hypothetical protein HDU76_008267 [Blyttiomyces sp. JEL0837]